MPLLTEEQIEQLVKIASVTSTVKSYHDKFCEWNEKQPSTQFEPDWSIAPKHAKSAVLSLSWVIRGNILFSGYCKEFERPAPVVTPHPRAEILAKYAEVAQRRIDPWVEFEYRCLSDEWSKCTEFLRFYADYQYRYIGDDK